MNYGQGNSRKDAPMRKLGMLIWALLVAGTAQAQASWVVESDPSTGRHAARACTEGGDASVCLELSCSTEQPLSWGMRTEGIADLVVAESVDALMVVGSSLVGTLEFESVGMESFRAPLEETHVDGLERLKAGMRADMRMWFGPEEAPELYRFGLSGSRKAISEVEALCPLPDFAAREVERRTQVDPGSVVLGELAEACRTLDGTIAVMEGFLSEVDLDGEGAMDLVVDHSLAECSTATSLVCSDAGCQNSFWLAQEDGRYRRVFLDTIQSYRSAEPGVVEITFQGVACGRGGGSCTRRYTVGPDALTELSAD